MTTTHLPSGPSPQRTTFNGWDNRSTWNVNLWIFGEVELYDIWKAECKRHAHWTIERTTEFVKQLWPSGKTPDGDSLDVVYWRQIADSFNESAYDHDFI